MMLPPTVEATGLSLTPTLPEIPVGMPWVLLSFPGPPASALPGLDMSPRLYPTQLALAAEVMQDRRLVGARPWSEGMNDATYAAMLTLPHLDGRPREGHETLPDVTGKPWVVVAFAGELSAVPFLAMHPELTGGQLAIAARIVSLEAEVQLMSIRTAEAARHASASDRPRIVTPR